MTININGPYSILFIDIEDGNGYYDFLSNKQILNKGIIHINNFWKSLIFEMHMEYRRVPPAPISKYFNKKGVPSGIRTHDLPRDGRDVIHCAKRAWMKQHT